MNIIDVTLRDGGFTCDFDWPIKFAQEYYELLSKLDVDLIELGYWKQTAKSKNRFFNLNMDTIKQVTKESGRKNVSIMIDYSYCNKNMRHYPTDNQNEIGLIRMTCRKDMINGGVKFAHRLKEYTGLDVAFNMFNTTNYTDDELDSTLDVVLEYDFDIIGFADTHGHLDLNMDIDRYEKRFERIKDSNKKTAFHLHNHTGKSYLNYVKCLESPHIDICDTSIMSLGKGAGNLKLENVLNDKDVFLLNDFILKYYDSIFKKTVSPYYLVTGRFGITDHYAGQAKENNMSMVKFASFCSTISGLDRDNFNKNLLEEFLN